MTGTTSISGVKELRKALEIGLRAIRDDALRANEPGKLPSGRRPVLAEIAALADEMLTALASQSPPPTDDVREELACRLKKLAGVAHLPRMLADPDDRPGMSWNVHLVYEADPNMRVAFMANGELSRYRAAYLVELHNAFPEILAALSAQLPPQTDDGQLRCLCGCGRTIPAQLPPPIRGEELTWLRSRLEEALADERDCISIHLTACDAQRLLEALATPSSPEGWVLVPREPTRQMIAAGGFKPLPRELRDQTGAICPGSEGAESVWAAMLAASPSSALGDE